MVKKVITNTHTFLVEEKNEKVQSDAIFGKSVLLSIYVGFNKKKNTKSGSYYFSDQDIRIALKSNVITIQNASSKEEELFNYIKKKKEVSFSTTFARKYNIEKYIKYYFVKEKNKDREVEEETYPHCKMYYSHDVISRIK